MAKTKGAPDAQRADTAVKVPAPAHLASTAKPAASTITSATQADPIRRTVVIRPAGTKWSLRIVPPLDGEDLDGTYDDHRMARGFAGGLRMCRGYAIDDAWEDRP